MVNETNKILRLLIENQEKRFSIRHISQLRKINYKSAYMAVMKLEKERIINLERLGNTTNCSFNQKFNPLVFSVEYKRREELLKNKNFKIIYSRLKELIFPFMALLFGSYAKKKQNQHSDIDVLIITNISENKKEIQQIISLIPLDIHLTIISYKEFTRMAKSKEFSVVSEATKKNIILIGIEDYYRLLENVK